MSRPLLAVLSVLFLSLVLALPVLTTKSAYAQTSGQNLELPKRFNGRTIGVGVSVNVYWSMEVSAVSSDGTVHGKITYAGTTCGAKNASFVGKYDGKRLSIPMPFSGNPYCKGWVFDFTRQDGTFHFETLYHGAAPNNMPITLKVTLDPE